MFTTEDYLLEIKMLFLLLIPVSVIAVFVIVIPYIISAQTLFVTPVIFLSMISFLIFLRSKYFWCRKDRKSFDKVATIISWVIFAIVMPTLVLIALLIFVFYKKSIYFSAWILSITFLFILGIRLKIRGNLYKGQCITIGNHRSILEDIFLSLIMGFYRIWKVVFAKGPKRVPFAPIFLKYMGFPLIREERRSRKETYDKISAYLKCEKGNIFIFPEGKRMPVEEKERSLMDFKVGAFRLSLECNIPIQPVVILGSGMAKPRSKQWWIIARTIEIHYLPLIWAKKEEKPECFCKRVWIIMSDEIEKQEQKKKKRWKLI